MGFTGPSPLSLFVTQPLIFVQELDTETQLYIMTSKRFCRQNNFRVQLVAGERRGGRKS